MERFINGLPDRNSSGHEAQPIIKESTDLRVLPKDEPRESKFVKVTIPFDFDGTALYPKAARSRPPKKETSVFESNVLTPSEDTGENSPPKPKIRRVPLDKAQLTLDRNLLLKKKPIGNVILLLKQKADKRAKSKSKGKRLLDTSSQLLNNFHTQRSPSKPKEAIFATISRQNSQARSPPLSRNGGKPARPVKPDIKKYLERSLKFEGRHSGSGYLNQNYFAHLPVAKVSTSRRKEQKTLGFVPNFSKSPNTSERGHKQPDQRDPVPNIFIKNSTFVNQLISNMGDRGYSPRGSPKPLRPQNSPNLHISIKKKSSVPKKNLSLKSIITERPLKKDTDNEYLITNDSKNTSRKKHKLHNKVFEILRNIVKE